MDEPTRNRPLYELRNLVALLERQEAERQEKDRRVHHPIIRTGDTEK